VANFISGAGVEGGNINYNGRTIRFDKYVVGIDCRRFVDTINEPEVQTRIQELEAQYKDKTIIIGVDRMDYTKGLPEKMEGFRVFLDEHPELSEKVVLIQIAIPSREDVKKYQDLEAEVSKLVGQINGKYGKCLRKSIRLHTRMFWDWYLANLWISC
jgi:trehalose 6-phosphate synthase